MGTHNDASVTINVSVEGARFLIKSIAATPLQGSLTTLSRTVSTGLSLMECIQSAIEEHEQRHPEHTEAG
jgi:hypothetical protein